MVEETFPICHDENANEAFKKVIQIGEFTEVNAGNVDSAKFELEHIDDAELRTYSAVVPRHLKKTNSAVAA